MNNRKNEDYLIDQYRAGEPWVVEQKFGCLQKDLRNGLVMAVKEDKIAPVKKMVSKPTKGGTFYASVMAFTLVSSGEKSSPACAHEYL